jgi:moderate conductance mechanosensitive channel
VVTNMTKEYSYYVFDIGVAYREDTDEVTTVIEAVGKDLQKDPNYKDDILAPLEVVGLDKLADSAVVIKARLKTKPIKQWRVGREFNRRLKKRFDELNIEIPFPHVTVYPGKDKKGDSPTLKVEVQGSGG